MLWLAHLAVAIAPELASPSQTGSLLALTADIERPELQEIACLSVAKNGSVLLNKVANFKRSIFTVSTGYAPESDALDLAVSQGMLRIVRFDLRTRTLSDGVDVDIEGCSDGPGSCFLNLEYWTGHSSFVAAAVGWAEPGKAAVNAIVSINATSGRVAKVAEFSSKCGVLSDATALDAATGAFYVTLDCGPGNGGVGIHRADVASGRMEVVANETDIDSALSPLEFSPGIGLIGFRSVQQSSAPQSNLSMNEVMVVNSDGTISRLSKRAHVQGGINPQCHAVAAHAPHMAPHAPRAPIATSTAAAIGPPGWVVVQLFPAPYKCAIAAFDLATGNSSGPMPMGSVLLSGLTFIPPSRQRPPLC